MKKNDKDEYIKLLNCALKLERKVTGVKFIFTEEEYRAAEAQPITGKLPYCVMVKSAMAGKGTKAAAENFGCNGAAKALGVVEPGEISTSGRFYESLGLYQDLTVSKNVQKNTTFCGHKAYGVMVKPLEEFKDKPDVVLIVTNPYNSMRIVQGYTNIYGYNVSYKISGNQAVCSECTAFPFENNDINVSMMCAGTRYKAAWDDNELIIGFPYNRFYSIVDGVIATLDLTEPDNKKSDIERRFKDAGITCPEIHYGKNYFTGLNPV